MRVCLWGYHSCRTPFAYSAYQRLLKRDFEYTDDPYKSDFIIVGYILTFREQRELLKKVLERNPNVRLVVVSEEPVWDTLWCREWYGQVHVEFALDENMSVQVTQLTHETSQVFNFHRVPYFLTTENKYIDRYLPAFRRVLSLKAADLRRIWENAPFKYAFIAEHRNSKTYAPDLPMQDVVSLNCYRTELAERFRNEERILIEGKGWGHQARRQDLPDWHLEKLAKLQFSAHYLSAIENTHQINYVSEKLFDAFACAAVPIYYAMDSHRVHELIDNENFLNVCGLEPAEVEFKSFSEEHYLTQVMQLWRLLQFENISKERERVVHQLKVEFENIVVKG